MASHDPVIEQLKRSRRGDHIVIKAHLLNEANQEKVKEYVEKQNEVTIFSVQGAIGLAGLRRFSGVMCRHVETLTRVSLRANDLRLPAVLDVICALQLPQNKALELLDLSSNPIGSEGFKALAKNLMLNETLAALLLSQCAIGDCGVVQSLAWIQGKARPASGRYYINLSRNNIGVEGHAGIAAALPNWMSLSLTRQKPPVLQQTSPAKSPPAATTADSAKDSTSDDSSASLHRPPAEPSEDDDDASSVGDGGDIDADAVDDDDAAPPAGVVSVVPPATLKACLRHPITRLRRVTLPDGRKRTTIHKAKRKTRRLYVAKTASK